MTDVIVDRSCRSGQSPHCTGQRISSYKKGSHSRQPTPLSRLDIQESSSADLSPLPPSYSTHRLSPASQQNHASTRTSRLHTLGPFRWGFPFPQASTREELEANVKYCRSELSRMDSSIAQINSHLTEVRMVVSDTSRLGDFNS